MVANEPFGKYFHADGDRFAFIKGGELGDLKKALGPYPAAKVTNTDTFVRRPAVVDGARCSRSST